MTYLFLDSSLLVLVAFANVKIFFSHYLENQENLAYLG